MVMSLKAEEKNEKVAAMLTTLSVTHSTWSMKTNDHLQGEESARRGAEGLEQFTTTPMKWDYIPDYL